MVSVDDDVCPNAKRLPRILAFFFSALLATCAAILSLSFMPVACVDLLDHTYRAWPPQALQKLRQLIFRRPARETIQANARRAQQVGLWEESMGGRGSQVKSSQVKSSQVKSSQVKSSQVKSSQEGDMRKKRGAVAGTKWSAHGSSKRGSRGCHSQPLMFIASWIRSPMTL